MTTEPNNNELVEANVRLINPMMMLARLIELNKSPEEMAAMTAFAERWRDNAAKEAYQTAMNTCQKEMPTVVRDKKNTETHKMYAPVETVQAYAKPIYSKHGFSLSFGTERGSSEGLTDVYVDVLHVNGWRDRYFLRNLGLDDKGPKGGAVKTVVQGMMSTMSYAQGRLIRMVFNIIVADEDRDGQIGSAELTDDETVQINTLFDALRKKWGQKTYDGWLPGFWDWVSKMHRADVTDLYGVNRKNFGKIVDSLQRQVGK